MPHHTVNPTATANTTHFVDVPIGSSFVFRGEVFRKLATRLAADHRRWGCVFLDETEVSLIDAPAPEQ